MVGTETRANAEYKFCPSAAATRPCHLYQELAGGAAKRWYGATIAIEPVVKHIVYDANVPALRRTRSAAQPADPADPVNSAE